MNRPSLPTMGSRSTKLTGAAVASAVALAVAGAGSPAVSAPTDQCPSATPISSLAAGQSVDGLTVSQGTTPEPFTGEVLGVLNDGIAPGLDMILVRLSSAEVDRVGIWAGMSGSPVYAADGTLIGAVSYALSFGPSPVAGVTPAGDMQDLLASAPANRLHPSLHAELDGKLKDRLVQDGTLTRAQADQGMSQLKLPFGLAGLPQARVKAVAKKLKIDLTGMRLAGVGNAAAAANFDTTLVAGGNVAAALSYGDITAAGVGTVTAVCGNEVLGFGHPMLHSGPSTLSLHAADAIYVQEDPVFGGFKVANIAAEPVGTITQDRLAGIKGDEGAGPATGQITSRISAESRVRDGETKVTVPEYMPDIAFAHILANEGRVFDGYGKGGANVDWSVSGTREDGRPFSISLRDVYASEYDITFESVLDVIDALYLLEYNGVEDITIDNVDYNADLTRSYDHYVIKKTEMKVKGTWTTISKKNRLPLRAGSRKPFRITVESPDSGTKKVVQALRIPQDAAGRYARVRITGGNSYYNDDYFYYDEYDNGRDQTFDQILDSVKSAPRNDDVVVGLEVYNNRGRLIDNPQRGRSTGLVVDGRKNFRAVIR